MLDGWLIPSFLLCLESGLTSWNRGFSQAFYRQKLYETALGYKDLEDFLQNHWEKWACSKGNRHLPGIVDTVS
jgi:homoserine O-acetyltransferase